MTWVTEVYGRRRGMGKADTKLQPITYSKGADKMKAEVHTPASYGPISTQQGTDRYAADILKNAKPGSKGYAGRLYDALASAGLQNEQLMKMAIVQLYMESAGFSNGPALKDNNPGNIMWFAGQKKGTYIPSNKTYAIHFDNLDKFAQQYMRELSKGARPIDATSVEDFVHRLKLNGYMGKESEESYLQKMMATAKRLDQLNSFYKTADAKMKKAAHEPPFWKRHPILAGLLIAGGAVVVIKIVK